MVPNQMLRLRFVDRQRQDSTGLTSDATSFSQMTDGPEA
jgi:hypothetical protein